MNLSGVIDKLDRMDQATILYIISMSPHTLIGIDVWLWHIRDFDWGPTATHKAREKTFTAMNLYLKIGKEREFNKIPFLKAHIVYNCVNGYWNSRYADHSKWRIFNEETRLIKRILRIIKKHIRNGP